MKKILIPLLLIICTGCRVAVTELLEFDNAALFGADGCLNADTSAAYDADMPCLDKNKDGCITREEWEAFMDYWHVHTPEAGRPLCEQVF